MIVVCKYIKRIGHCDYFVDIEVSKKYEAELIKDYPNFYLILDNSGKKNLYPTDNFYTIEEYRSLALKELGI